MQIETAVNFHGKYVQGHIVNNQLTITELFGKRLGTIIEDKEKLNLAILELQQVYSTMIQNEKINKQETPRTVKPPFTSASSSKQTNLTDKF